MPLLYKKRFDMEGDLDLWYNIIASLGLFF